MVQVSDAHGEWAALINRLNQAGIEWDAETIADWLWLSQYMEGAAVDSENSIQENPLAPPAVAATDPIVFSDPVAPIDQSPTQTPEPPSSADTVGLYSSPDPDPPSESEPSPARGIPFQTPTAPALRKTLAIGRALRPLMRRVDSYTQMVLDEDATAEQSAEQRVCMTVVKPAQERWLEVALVIEDSASSFLWHETLRDFKQVLEQQGAFRAVRVWHLQTSPQLALVAGQPGQGTPQKSRSPRELIDVSGRRLILLASDCISSAWRSGQIQHDYLQVWAEHGPVAIVQMLPGHLWRRTALNAALTVQLGALNPGVANRQLLFKEMPLGADSDPSQGLKLPVVTLEPACLTQWGRMVAGLGESWATGVWFDQGWQAVAPESSAAPTLTAEQLVQRFLTTASPLAKQLAGLMALVPVSLPIIYLLQGTMLRDSTPLHLAEVFMSGLIERVDDAALEPVPATPKVYDFVDGVRDLLAISVGNTTAETVLDRVSQYIGQKLKKSIYTFTALLLLEQELGETGGTDLQQFAEITRQTLRRMGGRYADIVDAIESSGSRAGAAPTPDPGVEYPPLQTLDFVTARFLEPSPTAEPTPAPSFPPIQTKEFTVTTVTLEADPTSSPIVLQPFEFTVATMEHDILSQRWAVRRQQGQAQCYTELLNNAVSLMLVYIPGGNFEMGSPKNEHKRAPSENPQHRVEVPSFLMGRYPLTQAQWQTVVAMPKIERELNPDPSYFKGENRPVERVSWYEAIEFCARLSAHTGHTYRLPSEAEWEYACRAGTNTPFHFGQTIIPELANYNGNYRYNNGPKGEYREQTTPVDHFGVANAFGLCDMHGNVWEWCADHLHSSYKGAPTDGSTWLMDNKNAARVIRGGSWDFNPWDCRSATRLHSPPRVSYYSIGIRLVCSAPGSFP